MVHCRLTRGTIETRAQDLQLRAGGLHWTRRGEFLTDCLTALSAGKLALALPIEASFISIDG
jgi:hypothetical protein